METLENFWQWYGRLFSDPDSKVRLAAISATVAVLGFILTFLLKPLRKWFLGLFKKIKVEAGISHVFITSPFGTGAGIPELVCTITNKGDKSIYIHQPSIRTSKRIGKFNTFTAASLTPRHSYPFKLEPGQQHKFECNTADLYRQVLNHLEDNDKVKFIVTLTTKKKYYSNSFTKKHIATHLEAARRNR